MKRSEMITMMVQFLEDHKNKIGYGWSEEDFMDNLLADMEINGMLPSPESYSTLQAIWESCEFEWEKE